MSDLPPNHHAHYRQFSGVFGYVAGLTMLDHGDDARLVTEMAALAATDHVVDIGCGPGTAVRVAARQAGRVAGVDPSRPMLHLGAAITRFRRPSGRVDWVCAGAEEMPLEDDSATVVWSLASVHHWPDLEGGLAEVARVLRPGGRFIALEKRTEAGATGNASHGWTPQQAEAFAGMLSDLGLSDVETEDHDLGRRQVVTVSGRR